MDLHKQIIFEDQDLLIINKPAGLVVNRAESNKLETFQDWLVDYLHLPADPQKMDGAFFAQNWQEIVPSDFADEFGSPEEIFQQRQGVVHRLDKNTSGVLLAAKNPGALVNLLKQFRERQTHKTYLCLVHGKFQLLQGVITAPLGRARADRRKFAVVADGRPAVTYYQVKQFFPGLDLEKVQKIVPAEEWKEFKKAAVTYQQGFSLVECHPKTGRTHQIRVHMMHEHHSLVSDVTYMGKRRGKTDRVWCDRHFLHASQIEFTHPRSGELMKIEAPLAEDLKKAMGLLLEK